MLRGATRRWPFRRSRAAKQPSIEAFARFDALMANGQPEAAAAEMMQVVAEHPDHPIANFRLGTYYSQTSRPSEAHEHFLRAARSEDASGSDALLAKGVAARLAGLTVEAEQALRAAHELQPDDVHVGHHLAMQLLEADRGKDALAVLLRVGATSAPAVELYEPWALALALDGQAEAAAELLGRLAALYGGDANRLFAFARRADDYAATDLATACCTTALALGDRADIRAFSDFLQSRTASSEQRRAAGLQYRRYDALLANGRLAEAAAEIGSVVSANPDDVVANYRIGNYFRDTEHPSDAHLHFRRAAQGEPHNFNALLAKGAAARSAGMTAEAEQALRAAHAVQPDHVHVGHHLAMLLLETDRTRDALAVLQHSGAEGRPTIELHEPWALALALDDQAEAAGALLGRLAPLYGGDPDRLFAFARRADDYGATDLAKACCTAALAVGDRAEIRAFRDLLVPQVPASEADLERRDAEYHAAVAALIESGLRIDPPPPSWLGWMAQLRRFFYARSDPALADATARMCLALCPDLAMTAAHCASWRSAPLSERLRVGFLVPTYYPLLWGLSRELDRGRFTTVHLNPSPAGAPVLAGWNGVADRTVPLAGLSLRDARNAIAAERLDIIISDPYDPLAYQLAYARLAPVQCSIAEPSWCDGVATLDYHIGWGQAEPTVPEAHYRSPLALLERPPYWFERDHCRPGAFARSDFDLPAGRWYVCPQTPMKLHVAFDRLLGGILERDPEAIIVGLRGDWPFVGRLKARLRRSLGPLAQRVRFLPMLPPERAHSLLQLADAVIDSWPVGGMWSAYTALQLGVPTVTMPADVPFGRWMTAMYERIGVTDLIARDADDYVRLALRLAADPDWRRALGARIAERHTILVEDRPAVGELEQFLLAAVAAAHRGEAPRTFRAGAFVGSASDAAGIVPVQASHAS